MAPAVASEEDRLRLSHASDAQRVGRIAPGRRNLLLPQVRQAGKIVYARAADHPDNRFGHSRPLPIGRYYP